MNDILRLHQDARAAMEVKVLKERISLLESALREVDETLKQYADINKWMPTTHETTLDGMGIEDYELLKLGIGSGYTQVAGKKARAAREKIKEVLG